MDILGRIKQGVVKLKQDIAQQRQEREAYLKIRKDAMDAAFRSEMTIIAQKEGERLGKERAKKMVGDRQNPLARIQKSFENAERNLSRSLGD